MSREILHDLKEVAYRVAPTAMTVSAMGGLKKLAEEMYGLEDLNEVTANVHVGLNYKMAEEALTESFENMEDMVEALDGPVKLAAHQVIPEGVMPEVWNFTRVEKVAHLFDLATFLHDKGYKKEAADLMGPHDELAVRAFDWFRDYGQNKEANVPAEATQMLSSGAREYGKKMLKRMGLGAATGAGVALGAAPIAGYVASNTADDLMEKGRNKALETAAGTAGIAVGANQINNLLSRLTAAKQSMDMSEEGVTSDRLGPDKEGSPEDRGERPGEDTPYYVEETDGRHDYTDQKIDKEKGIHPLEKMAFHFALDTVLKDEKLIRENKIACVHAIAEFCERETVLFDGEKVATPQTQERGGTNTGGVVGGTMGALAGTGVGGGMAIRNSFGNLMGQSKMKGRLGMLGSIAAPILGTAGGYMAGNYLGGGGGINEAFGKKANLFYEAPEEISKGRERDAGGKALIAGGGLAGAGLGGTLGYVGGDRLADLMEKSTVDRGLGTGRLRKALTHLVRRSPKSLRNFLALSGAGTGLYAGMRSGALADNARQGVDNEAFGKKANLDTGADRSALGKAIIAGEGLAGAGLGGLAGNLAGKGLAKFLVPDVDALVSSARVTGGLGRTGDLLTGLAKRSPKLIRALMTLGGAGAGLYGGLEAGAMTDNRRQMSHRELAGLFGKQANELTPEQLEALQRLQPERQRGMLGKGIVGSSALTGGLGGGIVGFGAGEAIANQMGLGETGQNISRALGGLAGAGIGAIGGASLGGHLDDDRMRGIRELEALAGMKRANAVNPAMYQSSIEMPSYPNGPAGAPAAGPEMVPDQQSMMKTDSMDYSGGDSGGKTAAPNQQQGVDPVSALAGTAAVGGGLAAGAGQLGRMQIDADADAFKRLSPMLDSTSEGIAANQKRLNKVLGPYQSLYTNFDPASPEKTLTPKDLKAFRKSFDPVAEELAAKQRYLKNLQAGMPTRFGDSATVDTMDDLAGGLKKLPTKLRNIAGLVGLGGGALYGGKKLYDYATKEGAEQQQGVDPVSALAGTAAVGGGLAAGGAQLRNMQIDTDLNDFKRLSPMLDSTSSEIAANQKRLNKILRPYQDAYTNFDPANPESTLRQKDLKAFRKSFPSAAEELAAKQRYLKNLQAGMPTRFGDSAAMDTVDDLAGGLKKLPTKLRNIAGLVGLGGGALYGGKKLYDHFSSKEARLGNDSVQRNTLEDLGLGGGALGLGVAANSQMGLLRNARGVAKAEEALRAMQPLQQEVADIQARAMRGAISQDDAIKAMKALDQKGMALARNIPRHLAKEMPASNNLDELLKAVRGAGDVLSHKAKNMRNLGLGGALLGGSLYGGKKLYDYATKEAKDNDLLADLGVLTGAAGAGLGTASHLKLRGVGREADQAKDLITRANRDLYGQMKDLKQQMGSMSGDALEAAEKKLERLAGEHYLTFGAVPKPYRDKANKMFSEGGIDAFDDVMKYIDTERAAKSVNPKMLRRVGAGGALAGAALYGGKKLYDHFSG